MLFARKRQKRNNANSLCRISPKRYNFAEIIERYMANNSKVVPVPVLRRMPAYLSFVKTLQKQGEKYVSSTRIAEYMEIDATQVTVSYTHLTLPTKA